MTDFYQIKDKLPPKELETLRHVRWFMKEKVEPIINKYWIEDKFPFEIIEGFKELNLDKITGPILMEMARVDPSIATFALVHYGLAIASIEKLGTEEQKQKWLPPLKRFEKIGCFALTEPDVGSGIGGEMYTVATKHSDFWIIYGKKKWAGNAVFADIVIVWARLEGTDGVRGFIVDTKTDRFTVEKIENKFGLKCVQNGLITMNNIQCSEMLQGSYKDILRDSRVLVAWLATGVQMGAFECALKYSKERKQFGKPIASFQLIQDLLAKILSNVTACQCMVHQLSQLQFTDAQAALAKAFTTSKMRESVAWAREIFGGNGLSIDYNIGRFFADAEAIYSYEGTYQIQNLIVGKAITGLSAFV